MVATESSSAASATEEVFPNRNYLEALADGRTLNRYGTRFRLAQVASHLGYSQPNNSAIARSRTLLAFGIMAEASGELRLTDEVLQYCQAPSLQLEPQFAANPSAYRRIWLDEAKLPPSLNKNQLHAYWESTIALGFASSPDDKLDLVKAKEFLSSDRTGSSPMEESPQGFSYRELTIREVATLCALESNYPEFKLFVRSEGPGSFKPALLRAGLEGAQAAPNRYMLATSHWTLQVNARLTSRESELLFEILKSWWSDALS